jgi:8-oxo-dGTP pyrophosphatase MutT (NUDIX family)
MDAIRYQAAGGIVVDTDNRVLVLRRPSRNEVRLPKGHVEKGESHLGAALREVAEESGYSGLTILADLGHQLVRFGHKGRHIVRDEFYFLLQLKDARNVEGAAPELQFIPEWVDWNQALAELTFEAEREWVRRARAHLEAKQDVANPPE